MATQSLLTLYNRDLNKLAEEIRLYPGEEAIWKVAPGISNSAGNLCLHLCGNLQHFIGTVLGNTGYVRNREAEFSSKNIPREKLLEEIEKTKAAIAQVLPDLPHEQLHAPYPVEVFGHPMATVFFLMHLATHLGYHLGQVNYHRRMIA
ncbi:MAG: DUF1572 family protein [Cyclobacteriaceae bacterium]|nr:DUF1572 family protein [Cyclobacteriaceae bacterium]